MSIEHRIPHPTVLLPTSRALLLLACFGVITSVRPLVAQNFAQPAAVAQPSPKLSPEDVVRAQITALSAAGPIPSRIERCYRFASPANRTHTGPIQRFAALIQSPSYVVLLDAKHFQVGRAKLNGREAHLLLTVIDANGNLCLFRCFLSKQTAAPYTDCWMTDAVIRIGEVNPPQKPPRPATQQTASI